MNLDNWQSLPEWEKGVRLGAFLAQSGMDMDDYESFTGGNDLSLFQVKRFKNYVDDVFKLDEGWYWVSTCVDGWYVAYYTEDGVFQVLGDDYLLNDLVRVDPRPIVREGEE